MCLLAQHVGGNGMSGTSRQGKADALVHGAHAPIGWAHEGMFCICQALALHQQLLRRRRGGVQTKTQQSGERALMAKTPLAAQ